MPFKPDCCISASRYARQPLRQCIVVCGLYKFRSNASSSDCGRYDSMPDIQTAVLDFIRNVCFISVNCDMKSGFFQWMHYSVHDSYQYSGSTNVFINFLSVSIFKDTEFWLIIFIFGLISIFVSSSSLMNVYRIFSDYIIKIFTYNCRYRVTYTVHASAMQFEQVRLHCIRFLRIFGLRPHIL